MPIITDVPNMEEQFRRTFLIENCELLATPKVSLSQKKYNYTLTPTDFNQNAFREDYLIISNREEVDELGIEASIISLANELFQGNKPLMGKEMDALNKTFARLRSSTPTKL